MSILKPELVQYLIVHCSATNPSIDVGVKEINQWHKNKGWSEIGYHIVIRRKPGPYGGLIEYGTRTFMESGAHVKGYNSVSLGICLVGGVDENNKPENNFTEAQFGALCKTITFLSSIFPKAKIQGHRDFPDVKKACPCFDVVDWWNKKVFYSMSCVQPEPILADAFEWK